MGSERLGGSRQMLFGKRGGCTLDLRLAPEWALFGQLTESQICAVDVPAIERVLSIFEGPPLELTGLRLLSAGLGLQMIGLQSHRGSPKSNRFGIATRV
jgi:hypothetical protein